MRWIPLVLIAATAEAAPRVTLPALPSLRAMTRAAAKDQPPLAASCFAYNAKSHSFACMGHDAIYNMDHVGADDQATNIRVDVVGPLEQRSWTIAAIGKRPTIARKTVENALGDRSLRALTTPPVAIAANTWVSLGAMKLRLRVETAEGDASFENFGDLTLRCGKQDVVIDLRAAGIELGETAVAFRSPDGNWLALTISGLDGGEDTYDYYLDTAVIDLATTCAHRSPSMWTTISRPEAE